MKIVFAIVGISILCSWSAQQKSGIEKVDWLIGTWENKTPRGSIYESWSKISDGELSGQSYMIKEKDTIVFEVIQLIQELNNFYYIPQVKDQNEGLAVRFASKTVSDTLLVFENLQHDFPQFISYTKINIDSLVAEISGTKNGKDRKQTFPMKRVK